MQSVSAGFTTACAAAGRYVYLRVDVSWDKTGDILAGFGGTGWTDETDYLVSFSGDLRLNAPGDELVPPGDVGQATVIMNNQTHRYSVRRTDGPLYGDIGGATGLSGVPIRLWVGFFFGGSAEYVRVFTGVISDWQENTDQRQIIFQCQDQTAAYLQIKKSTGMYQDQRADNWIAHLCDLVGITSSYRDLEPDSYTIPFCWLDDESCIEEMWATAQSVGGRCWADELGILRYTPAQAWAGNTAIQWTFTGNSYVNLRPLFSPKDVASSVVVEWSSRVIGQDGIVYTLDSAKQILPSKTLSFEARFDRPVMAVNDLTSDDYHIASSGGLDQSSNVTITIAPATAYAQRCTVEIQNNHTSAAAILDFLQIGGQQLIGGPTEQVTVDGSPAPDLTRTRSVRGNIYLQTYNQAKALADFLAERSKQLQPNWLLDHVPGVPQLELGDRIRIQNTNVASADIEGFVIGIHFEAGLMTGFSQSLTVLDAANLYPYDNYFVIGTDALGNNKRCWY